MATIPTENTPHAQDAAAIERRFRELEAAWDADTLVLSDADRIIGHWAFQEIIRMGEAVIPLMLRDLERGPHQWVWALPRITGANPVPPADAGNLRTMADAWLRWGREHGYRW